MMAAHEQALREKLAETPLTTKAETSQAQPESVSDSVAATRALEQEVGRSACKKLSARRLAVNELMHKNNDIWNSSTRFSDSHLALQFSDSVNFLFYVRDRVQYAL